MTCTAPAKLKLRPYQDACIAGIHEQLKANRSTLAVLPTGAGKTVIFGHVARDWQDGRVLVMAHREELIWQAAEKIERITGEQPEIEMADLRANSGSMFRSGKIVVTSVQTMSRENRHQRFRNDEFSIIIVDESHRIPCQSYRKVLDYFSGNPWLKILGVTATPDRSDEQALGKVFESVAYEYTILDAINDGYLVPIRQQFIQVEDLDFSSVRTTAGDLNGGDLEQVLLAEKALHGVVTPTIEIAGDRTTLVFAASVAHAELMAEIFNRHKPASAVCIHGETPKELRREQLKRFNNHEFQFLCNCGVFLEGFDAPHIEVVSMARPTKSRSLYAQAVGRGTRPIVDLSHETAEERRAAIAASKKPNMLVLDFVGNSGRHKLISTADILGGNFEDDIIQLAEFKAKENGKKTGGQPNQNGDDMLALLQEAEEEIKQQKARERLKLVAKAKYQRANVNPFDVLDLTPQRQPGWHAGRPISDKMRNALEKAGIATKDLNYTKAKQLLGEVFKRRESGLCSFKQAKILSRHGFGTNVSFEQASATIDAIAKSGWKLMNDVA